MILRSVHLLVGANAIRELLDKGHLRFELSYEEMWEEICNFIGWNPMLVVPWRRNEDLAKLGLMITEVIDGPCSADEEVAERLFSFLAWEGIEDWLSMNGG